MIIWQSLKPYLLQQRYWKTKVLQLKDRKKRERKTEQRDTKEELEHKEERNIYT
jgi:hypothetical protein